MNNFSWFIPAIKISSHSTYRLALTLMSCLSRPLTYLSLPSTTMASLPPLSPPPPLPSMKASSSPSSSSSSTGWGRFLLPRLPATPTPEVELLGRVDFLEWETPSRKRKTQHEPLKMQENLGTRRLLWELAISLDSITAHLIFKLVFANDIKHLLICYVHSLYTCTYTIQTPFQCWLALK